MVNPRIHVGIGGVTQGWIGEVGPVQGAAKRREIIADILFLGVTLRQFDFRFLRIDVDNRLAGCPESGISRVRTIYFQDVTAGDRRCRQMLRFEFVDIDTVAVAFDFLFKNINAIIIRGRDTSAGGVHVDLGEARARRVTPDVIAQFEDERVVDEDRLKIIRRVHDPVRFRGHAKDWKAFSIVKLIPPFYFETFLRIINRAGAPDTDACPRAEHGSIGERCSAVDRLEYFQVGRLIEIRGNGPKSEIVDHHDGKIRDEVKNVRRKLQIGFAA